MATVKITQTGVRRVDDKAANAAHNNFNDFGDPNLNFPNYAGFGSDISAAGGFVLYPSKPNTNTLRSVYSK